MNRWIILHDDGQTPAIHCVEINAPTMAQALERADIKPENVWACALRGHQGAAATSILRQMNLGVIELQARGA